MQELSVKEQVAHDYDIILMKEFKDAKEEYEKSMSLFGPGMFIIVGFVFLFLTSFLFLFGLLILIIGVIWAFLRVMGRSHAYQRYKDAESAYRRPLGDKS